MKPLRVAGVLGLLALPLYSCWHVSNSVAQDNRPNPSKRREFMRLKLDHAKNTIEGLALEDFEQVRKAGRALSTLSRAAEWEVPTIPNAREYLALSAEFERHALDLEAKARDKNLDGATLAYMELTMSCVKCHKFVRAGGAAPTRVR